MAETPHSHDEIEPTPLAETPIDAGSQALSEALRSSFGIVKFLLGLLIIIFLASGIFQVGPQERAIKLRFHLKKARLYSFEPKVRHNHYLQSYD